MPESCDSISRRSHGYEPLSVSFNAGKCLLLIALASLSAQETKGMAWESWNCLEVQNKIITFLCFFQVLFSLFAPPKLVFLIWNCSLYNKGWIRFENMISILSNYDLWSWFDSLENHSKNRLKPIFLCSQKPCTNSITCQLDIRPETCTRSWGFNVLDFFMICFD